MAWVDLGGREARRVWASREALGLEGVPSALPVGAVADAHKSAGKEVARIELHARLVAPDGQLAAAARIRGAASRRNRSSSGPVSLISQSGS